MIQEAVKFGVRCSVSSAIANPEALISKEWETTCRRQSLSLLLKVDTPFLWTMVLYRPQSGLCTFSCSSSILLFYIQWHDIVHGEHKLSWFCFRLPKKPHTNTDSIPQS